MRIGKRILPPFASVSSGSCQPFTDTMLGTIPTFQTALLAWYDKSARDLPWRATLPVTGRPDPYHVLLSEFMLQQTQVATVIPYFAQFLRVFPTIRDLANAEEQQVLRLWQGLGYYSRARNLLKAAKQVVENFGGAVPVDVESLLTLPGVGRYTAGAIASIAHETRAPILDGNVMRVVCRIDAIRTDPRDKPTTALLWARAEELVPKQRPGDFNSALMELGATVCIPRNPQCLICPVARSCSARELGIQDQIPPAKKAKETPHERRYVYCLFRERDGKREYAFEQRPANGRWAGMWQFVTRPVRERAFESRSTRELGSIDHALTHRRYTFEVRLAKANASAPSATWSTLEASEALPLPKPHVRIRAMLQDAKQAGEPTSRAPR